MRQWLSLLMLSQTVTLAMAGEQQSHHHDHHDAGAAAHSNPAHSSHNHAAHTHGIADLRVAMSEGVVEIEFESPAANLIGFEHPAQTPQEQQRVRAAEERLSDHDSLFQFKGTQCTLETMSLDLSHLAYSGEDHEDHPVSSEVHSNVMAHYAFTCDALEAIESISIELQTYFKQIETLKVMWVYDHHQGQINLTEKRHTLSLGR